MSSVAIIIRRTGRQFLASAVYHSGRHARRDCHSTKSLSAICRLPHLRWMFSARQLSAFGHFNGATAGFELSGLLSGTANKCATVELNLRIVAPFPAALSAIEFSKWLLSVQVRLRRVADRGTGAPRIQTIFRQESCVVGRVAASQDQEWTIACTFDSISNIALDTTPRILNNPGDTTWWSD